MAILTDEQLARLTAIPQKDRTSSVVEIRRLQDHDFNAITDTLEAIYAQFDEAVGVMAPSSNGFYGAKVSIPDGATVTAGAGDTFFVFDPANSASNTLILPDCMVDNRGRAFLVSVPNGQGDEFGHDSVIRCVSPTLKVFQEETLWAPANPSGSYRTYLLMSSGAASFGYWALGYSDRFAGAEPITGLGGALIDNSQITKAGSPLVSSNDIGDGGALSNVVARFQGLNLTGDLSIINEGQGIYLSNGAIYLEAVDSLVADLKHVDDADAVLQDEIETIVSGLPTVYQRTNQKGVASGYCELDSLVKVPAARLPDGVSRLLSTTTLSLASAGYKTVYTAPANTWMFWNKIGIWAPSSPGGPIQCTVLANWSIPESGSGSDELLSLTTAFFPSPTAWYWLYPLLTTPVNSIPVTSGLTLQLNTTPGVSPGSIKVFVFGSEIPAVV